MNNITTTNEWILNLNNNNETEYPTLIGETKTFSTPPACKGCANHPSNGGSGICHCILGLQTFY